MISTQMKIDIVTMTPEMAAQILSEKNLRNRRLRPSVVRKYSHAIRTGQWRLTQQGVAIGSDGTLLDGQHRLAAIVDADTPIQIALATDCDPTTFSVLDTGMARLAADVLHMKGASYSNHLAAGLKMYLLMQNYSDKVWSGAAPHYPTHAEIGDLFDDREDDASFASALAASAHSSCRQISRSATVAFTLLCIDAEHNRDRIEQFCVRLGSGVGLEDTSPILRLRAALTNGILATKRTSGGRLSQTHLACLIKAFNYWNEGVAIKVFKLPTIPPMPIVLP